MRNALAPPQEETIKDLVASAPGWLNFLGRSVLWLMRWNERRARDKRIENRVLVLFNGIEMYAGEPDSGAIHFYGTIVNLSSQPVKVDGVNVNRWSLGTYGPPAPTSMLKASGGADKGGDGAFSFDMSLSASDLRTVRRGIVKAHNEFSTPEARLALRGELVARCGKRQEHVYIPFEVSRDPIRISMSMPPANESPLP